MTQAWWPPVIHTEDRRTPSQQLATTQACRCTSLLSARCPVQHAYIIACCHIIISDHLIGTRTLLYFDWYHGIRPIYQTEWCLLRCLLQGGVITPRDSRNFLQPVSLCIFQSPLQPLKRTLFADSACPFVCWCSTKANTYFILSFVDTNRQITKDTTNTSQKGQSFQDTRSGPPSLEKESTKEKEVINPNIRSSSFLVFLKNRNVCK